MKLCKNSLTLKKVVTTLGSLAAFVHYEQMIGGVVWAPGFLLIIVFAVFFAVVLTVSTLVNYFYSLTVK